MVTQMIFLCQCGQKSNVFSGAPEHLGDFRSQEVLQIVAGGFPHTADLFGRLVIDEAIQKMLRLTAARRGVSTNFQDCLFVPSENRVG